MKAKRKHMEITLRKWRKRKEKSSYWWQKLFKRHGFNDRKCRSVNFYR